LLATTLVYAEKVRPQFLSLRQIALANEDQHRTFTVAEIEDTANSLDELEVELWHLQRAIEVRSPPPWTASSQHE
jgi:hypothetical protein